MVCTWIVAALIIVIVRRHDLEDEGSAGAAAKT